MKLSRDLSDPDARPYFLWSEPTTVGEFRDKLAQADGEEWARLVGTLMREARDPDVWKFVTPQMVWERFEKIDRYLGRRRPFWHYLMSAWHDDGFVA
ncbi:MAG: hypothetical protein SFV15_20000 [Polyangiaceae bacterium]|nr:hypothetical protein [Polyangiaceae bacterium]